jgi:hypothetical protein
LAIFLRKSRGEEFKELQEFKDIEEGGRSAFQTRTASIAMGTGLKTIHS